MKIGVLTSSRADFGIYLPLLNALEKESFFDLQIIAFGTHLSEYHGYTLSEIEEAGFSSIHKIKTAPSADTPAAIAESMGLTMHLFASFWEKNRFDLVFALGDRYEMFAAISASSPFNINIAHIHGGETTLGAIDNAYRHSISLFSKYIFVSTESYALRAKAIVQDEAVILNVGALSIDNLCKIDFLDKSTFKEKYNIDLAIPTVLSTFHPETIAYEKNQEYIKEFLDALNVLREDYQIVLTLPNADTMGNLVREAIFDRFSQDSRVHIVESFGMLGYLSCMKHCSFLLGNTSSGFVEASYFPKYVINVGDRQKGRFITDNIINCPIKKEKIIHAVKHLNASGNLTNTFPYGKGDTAKRIVEILKREYEV